MHISVVIYNAVVAVAHSVSQRLVAASLPHLASVAGIGWG